MISKFGETPNLEMARTNPHLLKVFRSNTYNVQLLQKTVGSFDCSHVWQRACSKENLSTNLNRSEERLLGSLKVI